MTFRTSNLSVRLDADLKARWSDFCIQQNSTSSAGVRQVICRLLDGRPTVATATAVSKSESPDTNRRRLEVRLTESEHCHIQAQAEQQRMSANQWVINLIRANLAAEPQFGMAELRVLGESNSRLLAIGRNLNQIARQINVGKIEHDRLKVEHIEKLSRHIVAHTAQVSDAMRANIDRWRLI